MNNMESSSFKNLVGTNLSSVEDNKSFGLEQYKVTDIILDFLLSSSSLLKENVVKGGISLILHETDKDLVPARPTTDIDFHFYNEKDWINYVESCTEIASKNSELGIDYSMERAPKTTDNGARLYITATKIQSIKFHIDMNYGSSVLVDNIRGVNTYSVSTMLTDKLVVVCSSKIRRRVKDLYDIYLLSSNNRFYLDELIKDIQDRLSSKNIILDNIWYLSEPQNLIEVKQSFSKFVAPIDINFDYLIDRVTNFILILVNILSNKEGININRRWNGVEWIL